MLSMIIGRPSLPIMCMGVEYVYMWKHAHEYKCLGSAEDVSVSSEAGIQQAVSHTVQMPGAKLQSSTRAVYTLNH